MAEKDILYYFSPCPNLQSGKVTLKGSQNAKTEKKKSLHVFAMKFMVVEAVGLYLSNHTFHNYDFCAYVKLRQFIEKSIFCI